MAAAAGLAVVVIAASGAGSSDLLKEGFREPPREYSMEPFWSWNGTLERDKLIWQIDQMVEKGVYGAYMHARAGLNQSKTPYFSDGFWEAVRISVEHAEKAGFRAWIYDEDQWPSGDAGGRTRAANPDRYTAMGLEHRTIDVRGPGRERLRFGKEAMVAAARKTAEGRIDEGTLRDLTDVNRAGGEWEVPAGEWTVSVFEVTRGRRPLPNYINPEAVREFIRNTYEEYAKRFSRHFGKTIPGSFFDEIYNWAPAWDPILEERFRKNKGYELRRHLPLLYLEGGPGTIKVRCDYFEELTKLYEEAWFKQLSSWCERHNLKLTGHTNEDLFSIKDQGDYFRTWRHPQVPGTDNEDFRYTWPRRIGSWKPKQLSSIAHVYGRERAMVEALGGAGWTVTLEQARYGVNMLAAYGVNSFVIHLFHYAMDTPESMDDWPNSWFYENPYWKYFKKFADYTRRISYLNSQGKHVSDIAVLYPVEEVWSQGFGKPPAQPAAVERLVDRLVSEQLDCDLVDTDSLIGARAEAGGRMKAGEESYRVLVLPDVKTVSLAAYRRIAELAGKGVGVMALGSVPRHSAENGAEDSEVGRITEKLFGSRGTVAPNLDGLVRELRRRVPPDITVASAERTAIRYLHRRAGDREVYFLANGERKPVTARIGFASTGTPERWDPESGEITGLAAAERSGNATIINLSFEPWQAYYVVFGSRAPAAAPAERPAERTIELKGPWSLQLAQRELDYEWKADPGETRVEVPVADFRVERGKDNAPWRRVKLVDTLSAVRGAARYVSAWDAPWITRYVYQTRHPGQLGGSGLTFTRTFEVGFEPAGGWLEAVSDGEVSCAWNEQPLGSGRNMQPLSVARLDARRGRNTIRCTVGDRGFLLAQGEIHGANGELLPLRTSGEWEVSAGSGSPLPAFEFAWPPSGAWGDPPLRGERQRYPATVSYRVAVPPGARELEAPEVRGKWQLYADGQAVGAGKGGVNVSGVRTLVLRVELGRPEDGLQRGLVFRCGRAAASLGDWQAAGLDWYSGRGIYRTEFQMPGGKGRVALDLGELCYTGEVWLNGKLVEVLAWPPYRVDVTAFLKPGVNELTVVAANLLANEMRWKIFDSAMWAPMSRWWHDGNILRDGDKLRSGLVGPVRLVMAGNGE